MQCDVIVYRDRYDETTDIRRAVVFDINDEVMIFSQMNPPLKAAQRGKIMEVTFLDRRKSAPLRLGFAARFSDIAKNYRLASEERVTVVKLQSMTAPQELVVYDLRMFYRIKPGAGSGIEVKIAGRPVLLIDFSIGGLCFADRPSDKLKIKDLLTLLLTIDGETYLAKARMVRRFRRSTLRLMDYVCVQFVQPDKRLKHQLGRKSLEIERKLLSEGRP